MSKCLDCWYGEGEPNDSICYQCYLDDCEETAERKRNACLASTEPYLEENKADK